MRKYSNIYPGDRFGKWTVIEEVERKIQRNKAYKCRCDCGNVCIVKGCDLNGGCTTKCKKCKKGNEYTTSGSIVYVRMTNSNKIMLCDLEIWEDAKQYTWSVDCYGYARTVINGKSTRFTTKYFKTNDELQIDHINRNTLDNRRENIREVTQTENIRNRGMSKRNKTGFIGVSFCSGINKYKAGIGVNGKNKHLGYYDTPEEAYAARLKAEKECWG